MSDHITHVTDESFQKEVLEENMPTLVDYWATWCGPCQQIAPVLEEIAQDYADKLKVCKIDVDANPKIPAHYGIKGIPTLHIFKNGEVEATQVGAVSKKQLGELINGVL